VRSIPRRSDRAYEFGSFRLEPAERRLLGNGRPIAIAPKAFDTLQLLVEHAGHAVSKDELFARVWPDTTVTEATLAQTVFAARRAVGTRFIETVPKHGYRLNAAVRRIENAETDPDADVARPSCYLIVGRRRIPLIDGAYIVGRDDEADVILDDASVSRRHARITVDGSGARVEDLGSKNGTFVHGVRLTAPQVLVAGNLVAFASVSTTFAHRHSIPTETAVPPRGDV